jgi:hypothetical protein
MPGSPVLSALYWSSEAIKQVFRCPLLARNAQGEQYADMVGANPQVLDCTLTRNQEKSIMKTDRTTKSDTARRTLYLAAFAITLFPFAVQPASAIPCGVATPCPTNFAGLPGLPAAVRMIVSGGASVWALDVNFAIYRWNTTARRFDQMPGSLVWIAVKGGNVFQPDEVWGYNASGQYYRWTGSAWAFISVPSGGLGGLVIAKGLDDSCHPYEVWALGTFTRRNPNNIWHYSYCTGGWEQVAGQLASLSVGAGEIWGINYAGQVWRFDRGIFGGWAQIPGVLSSLAVGADGVWGVNSSQQVFQFDPATQTFVQIPNATLNYVAAGGNGVWGLNASHHVFRYQGISRTFALSPNVALNQITVGSGANVWGIDTNGNIRVFVTPAVQNTTK